MSTTQAEKIFEQIKAGHAVFSKTATGTWTVVGPAADVLVGKMITVTKADGTTKDVVPTQVGPIRTARGMSYVVADFRTLTEVRRSGLYGTGIHTSGEGHTMYESADGTYSTQIWDKS